MPDTVAASFQILVHDIGMDILGHMLVEDR